jgi:ABC-2 type transport system ATP-binding protein
MPKGRGAQDVLRAALEAGAPILGFQPEEARLRDVFVSLVGEAEAAALDVPGAATEAEAA